MKRCFIVIFLIAMAGLSFSIDIDLGVAVDVTQAMEQTLGCAQLAIMANVGVFAFDIPFAQVWPSERRIEYIDPLQSYAGLNFKLPITILYVKANLGVQIAGVLDLLGGKIEGWDLPSKARVALGVSDSGFFLEGGFSAEFTPTLDRLNFCPYAAIGVVF